MNETRPRIRRGGKALSNNLLLLVVGILTALVIGEIAVRILLRSGLLRDDARAALFPQVPYQGRFVPSSNEILGLQLDPSDPLINSSGFRGREVEIERTGAFRIVVLGDSVTFGRGVPLEETYPAILEELLNRDAAPERSYEVLNMGVGGYNTRQELEVYKVKGRQYAPDLVVIGFVLNDCLPAQAHLSLGKAIEQKESPSRLNAPPGKPRGPGAEGRQVAAPARRFESQLLALVRERLARLTRDETDAASMGPHRLCALPQLWSNTRRALAEISALATRDGTPVLLVLFPALEDLQHYSFAPIHRRVSREARSRGFHTLDLYGVFRRHSTEDLRLLPGDDTHPNALGYRLAAESIHAFLKSSKLL